MRSLRSHPESPCLRRTHRDLVDRQPFSLIAKRSSFLSFFRVFFCCVHPSSLKRRLQYLSTPSLRIRTHHFAAWTFLLETEKNWTELSLTGPRTPFEMIQLGGVRPTILQCYYFIKSIKNILISNLSTVSLLVPYSMSAFPNLRNIKWFMFDQKTCCRCSAAWAQGHKPRTIENLCSPWF